MKQNNIFINTFQKIRNSKIPEIIVLMLFIGLAIFVSCYHEPWFDEMYAWFLASHNSFWALLTEVPPTVGHPPLWHFILKTFTYTGISPDICLKFISLCFATSAAYLLLFKSSFPRIAKLFLPFTYFLFWHGCIVIRPYCMLMFAVFLNALLFKTKDEHPFRFMFSLFFMALTSAYGIVTGASIAISWLIEIYLKQKQTIKDFAKNCIYDKRFWAIVWVGIFCFLTVLNLISVNIESKILISNIMNSLLRITYVIFILPAELFYTNFVNDDLTDITAYPVWISFASVLAGLTILFLLKKVSDYAGKTIYFVLPWIMLTAFSIFVYIFARHFMVFTCLLIWFMWICYQDGFAIKNIPDKITRNSVLLMFIFAFIVNIYWSSCVIKNDIKYQYYSTLKLVEYIKANDIDKHTVFSPWFVSFHSDITAQKAEVVHSPAFVLIPAFTLPFFDNNFYTNFTYENGKIINNIRKYENIDTEKLIAYHAQKPYADFMIGFENFGECFLKLYNTNYSKFYKAIYFINSKNFFKAHIGDNPQVMIYIRKDLYDKFKKEHPNAVKSKDEF